MHGYRRHQLLELDLAELAAHDKVDQPQEETGRPLDRWKVRCHRFSLLFELFGIRLSTGPYSIDTWQREDVTEARARPTQHSRRLARRCRPAPTVVGYAATKAEKPRPSHRT